MCLHCDEQYSAPTNVDLGHSAWVCRDRLKTQRDAALASAKKAERAENTAYRHLQTLQLELGEAVKERDAAVVRAVKAEEIAKDLARRIALAREALEPPTNEPVCGYCQQVCPEEERREHWQMATTHCGDYRKCVERRKR